MNVYIAYVMRLGEKSYPFVNPIPAYIFYTANFGKAEVFTPNAHENSRITHMAFGRTREDVKRKLDRLGWRDYGKTARQMPEYTGQTSIRPQEVQADAAAELYNIAMDAFDREASWKGKPKH